MEDGLALDFLPCFWHFSLYSLIISSHITLLKDDIDIVEPLSQY